MSSEPLRALRNGIQKLAILGYLPPASDDRTEVEQMLDREIHDTEGLRAVILAIVFGLALALWIWALFARPEVAIALPGRMQRLAVTAALGVSLLVAVLIKPASVLLKRANRPPPLGGRLISAFIETSLPTALILALLGGEARATDALGFPSILYYPLIILSILRFDRWISTITGVIAGVEYAAVALWVLDHAPPDALTGGRADQLAKAAALVVSGALAGAAAARIRRWILKSYATLEERKRARDRFGQFVSPAVADRLLEQKDLGSEIRHVCVMFLDIRDFTSFSEKRGPEEVVRYLNTLFAFMIDAINEHNGIINKFLGDGFMAVFGAPLSDGKDCRNALAAARVILSRIDEMAARGAIPPTRVGIGLHTGPAVTGVIGTALRGEYTVIGDVVNLASRIESLNKEFGSCLLVSDEVLAAIGEHPHDAVGRGPVKVKGREAPVQLFQIA